MRVDDQLASGFAHGGTDDDFELVQGLVGVLPGPLLLLRDEGRCQRVTRCSGGRRTDDWGRRATTALLIDRTKSRIGERVERVTLVDDLLLDIDGQIAC